MRPRLPDRKELSRQPARRRRTSHQRTHLRICPGRGVAGRSEQDRRPAPGAPVVIGIGALELVRVLWDPIMRPKGAATSRAPSATPSWGAWHEMPAASFWIAWKYRKPNSDASTGLLHRSPPRMRCSISRAISPRASPSSSRHPNWYGRIGGDHHVECDWIDQEIAALENSGERCRLFSAVLERYDRTMRRLPGTVTGLRRDRQ